MDDPFDLARFVDAQNPVYGAVLRELKAGRKTSHWIWFIFPQAKALGRELINRWALTRGPRLRECVALLTSHEDVPLEDILGELDAKKFHSSMALFADAGGDLLRR